MYTWDPENSKLGNWDSFCVSIILASWSPSIFAITLGRIQAGLVYGRWHTQ
jgi:hypothetical protein